MQTTLLEHAKRLKTSTSVAATWLPSIEDCNGWRIVQLPRRRREDFQPASEHDQLAGLHAGAVRVSPFRRDLVTTHLEPGVLLVKPGMLMSDNDWSETGAVSWGRQIQSDFWHVRAQARELQMEMEDVD